MTHFSSTDTPVTPACTAFDGMRRLAGGTRVAVAQALAAAQREGRPGPLLVFDDRSGEQIDLDTRGSDRDIQARYGTADGPPPDDASPRRGRGRPRLGVVAREVTLLPRHWEWLAAQPGGASVALRRLVEAARKATPDRAEARRRHERAYRFMAAIAGDLAGFEEACRALFADDRPRFEAETGAWPPDVRQHALQLAFEPANATPTP
ncbi:MAG: DUF2239 family protein [Piscinibacter sp.]|nr:DUF2239 family protein [Piscinibacter sp.]